MFRWILTEDLARHYSQGDAARHQRIRRWARGQGLVATHSRRTGGWYFSDHKNCLRSPQQGLTDEEAERFLLPELPHARLV